MTKIKRALISVSDKEGIVDFAKGLEELGIEIISTGGTAQLLKDAKIRVKLISEVTNFPEILEGRVKTLHPFIFGGILARREDPLHQKEIKEKKIEQIDLVVVNLYPFEKTVSQTEAKLDDAIENIDIGGPSLLRAAAKNYQGVTVVINPQDYPVLLSELRENNREISLDTKITFNPCSLRPMHTFRTRLSFFLPSQHSGNLTCSQFSSILSIPPLSSKTPLLRLPSTLSLSSILATSLALAPKSLFSFLNLSSSSRTTAGMTISLSSKV